MVSPEKKKDDNQITGEKSGNETPVQKAVSIEFPSALSVRELSELLKVSPVDIIKRLIRAGIMANINQVIDFKTAQAIATDLGFEAHLSRHVAGKSPKSRSDHRFAAAPARNHHYGTCRPRQNETTGCYPFQ